MKENKKIIIISAIIIVVFLAGVFVLYALKESALNKDGSSAASSRLSTASSRQGEENGSSGQTATSSQPDDSQAATSSDISDERDATGTQPESETILYQNDKYGFTFSLPQSWEGYSIIQQTWAGYKPSDKGQEEVQSGPKLLIRNPKWTERDPYQDIPVMVFTLGQWDGLQRGDYYVSAAPINPSELGRNDKYVFALPARYNFAFPSGWDEVQKIMEGKPLQAF